MRQFLCSLILFTAVFSIGDVGWAAKKEAKPKHRLYERGPLTIKEFRGTPELHNERAAFTATRIKYEFEFNVERNESQFVASLTSLDVFAVFLPNRSWWGDQADPRLLDHEQGHFDIAEINVRQLQLAMAKLVAEGRPISAQADSKEAAYEKLRQRLQEVMRIVDQQNTQDNLEYDRQSRHGFRSRQQHEFRRVQKLTLKRLSKEVTKLNR